MFTRTYYNTLAEQTYDISTALSAFAAGDTFYIRLQQGVNSLGLSYTLSGSGKVAGSSTITTANFFSGTFSSDAAAHQPNVLFYFVKPDGVTQLGGLSFTFAPGGPT